MNILAHGAGRTAAGAAVRGQLQRLVGRPRARGGTRPRAVASDAWTSRSPHRRNRRRDVAASHDALDDLRTARRKNRLGRPRLVRGRVPRVPGGLRLRRRGAVGLQLHQGHQGLAATDRRHLPPRPGRARHARRCRVRGRSAQRRRGGPLAIEDADVRHVLLSPVDRRRALMRPAFQRARSSAFARRARRGIAGQLAGRRLPGSDASWVVLRRGVRRQPALLFARRGARRPRRAPSAAGCVTASARHSSRWQAVAIVKHIPGPGNRHGSLALWGMRQRAIDLIGLAVTVVLVVAGAARCCGARRSTRSPGAAGWSPSCASRSRCRICAR